MRIFIAISCCLVLLSWKAWIIGICYSVFRNFCTFVHNEMVVKNSPRLIFAIFKQYVGFRYQGDYSLVNKLPDQYLIISNHQSLLDIIAFMNYHDGTRLRFIAKKELGNNIPLISPMLKGGKHCLIQRTGSPTIAMKAIDKFAAEVRANNTIPVIFPEGSRSKDGNLRTFHAAGFRRFLNTVPMPVAVCAIDGGWQMSSLRRLAQNLRNGTYKIKLLKIYDTPTTKEDQVRILDEGKQLIQEQLDKWRSADV